MFEGMGTPAAAIADPVWRRAAHDWFTETVADPRSRIVVAEADGRGRLRARSAR